VDIIFEALILNRVTTNQRFLSQNKSQSMCIVCVLEMKIKVNSGSKIKSNSSPCTLALCVVVNQFKVSVSDCISTLLLLYNRRVDNKWFSNLKTIWFAYLVMNIAATFTKFVYLV
jgi:hypothetical protein